MPSAGKHFHLAIEYIEACRKLTDPELCRPLSLNAYYAAMQLYESMYAIPVAGLKLKKHFHSHRLRIHFAMQHKNIFGSAQVKALKSLYDFSYMSRYIAQDMTPIGTGAPKIHTIEIHLDSTVPKTIENRDQILKRLNRIIEKTILLSPPTDYLQKLSKISI